MILNFVGAMLWFSCSFYAGYFFGELPEVRKNFTLLMFGIILISVLPMVIGGVRARLAHRR